MDLRLPNGHRSVLFMEEGCYCRVRGNATRSDCARSSDCRIRPGAPGGLTIAGAVPGSVVRSGSRTLLFSVAAGIALMFLAGPLLKLIATSDPRLLLSSFADSAV